MDQTTAGPASPPWTTGEPYLIGLRQRLRRIASRHWPYLTFKRLRLPEMVVQEGTGLVIEGFPRCGNSFAEAAIRLLHREPRLELAHHTHCVAQVRRAIEQGIPTMILFRNPVDAVASLLLLEPKIRTPRQAFLDYADFYELILPDRDHFLLASFEAVIHDFPGVANALERRFGIRMSPCDDFEARRTEIFGLIDELTRQRGVGERVEYSPDNPPEVASARAVAKRQALDFLNHNDFCGSKKAALEVFGVLTRLAESSPDTSVAP